MILTLLTMSPLSGRLSDWILGFIIETIETEMQTDSVAIDILGTHRDGTFIANIRSEGKTFCAFYPAHLGNVLILHEYPDYVTRFVVFYENDSHLHPACRNILMREDLQLEDKSETGLEDLFRGAMDAVRAQENDDAR